MVVCPRHPFATLSHRVSFKLCSAWPRQRAIIQYKQSTFVCVRVFPRFHVLYLVCISARWRANKARLQHSKQAQKHRDPTHGCCVLSTSFDSSVWVSLPTTPLRSQPLFHTALLLYKTYKKIVMGGREGVTAKARNIHPPTSYAIICYHITTSPIRHL